MKYLYLFFLNLIIILFSIAFAVLSIYIDNFLGFYGFHSLGIIIMGLLIVFIGLFFRIKASLQFYKHKVKILTLKAQETLIKDGLFAHTRNPLYIGILLIFLGFMISVNTVSGLIMFIVVFMLCNWWVKNREEKYMEKAFTNEYRHYKKNTPRWL